MYSGNIGTLAEYRISGEWNIYQELYFIANMIEAKRQVLVLLTAIGTAIQNFKKITAIQLRPIKKPTKKFGPTTVSLRV